MCNCCLCNGNTKELLSINNFPIHMGINYTQNAKYAPLIYAYCTKCYEVQIINRIEQSLLYQVNHNVDLVGNIWQQHFKLLSEFIKPDIIDKEILEIGDPSAKLAKILEEHYKCWYIIEPNPAIKETEKIKIKNTFLEFFIIDKQYDCIVHSHVFEHAYNPNKFLEKCYNLLKDNGKMIFSIPDMNSIINKFCIPVLSLNFEHVYYVDILNIHQLLNNNGFEITDMYMFNGHSLFIKCKKSKKFNFIYDNKISYVKFQNNLKESNELVNNIKNKIKLLNLDLYLYGCHVTSQFLLNSIKENRFIGILDNSTYKQGKKLYGTNLDVLPPSVIKDNIGVITSHTGIYKNEIEKQLKSINNSVVFI